MINPRTILVVDDEVDFLSSMRRSLRKEPYQVITSDNGSAALQLLTRHEISLVISDYKMPEMDGLILLKKIRLDYPHIITIMLTALSEVDIAMKAVNDVGVYKFLMKPVEINSLKVTLRRALESLDLRVERDDLLQKIKRRDNVLNELERKHPGITLVDLDADGNYII
jgi:DNA-binding NtrC family response regulator